ncbi:MAG: hypothetical protein JW880_05400 [Candidatus Thermoplasmatota archaeon]|nr:hypothetical protein [Candidatus Thermoplasmatota archaeon]
MIRRDDAIGGFFEDLPVLLFVLLGVFVLISASVIVSDRMSEQRRIDWLGSVADDILADILLRVTCADAVGYSLTVAGMREMRLEAATEAAAGDAYYCASVVMLHPSVEWLCSAAKGDPRTASNAGFAETLFSAISDDGSTAIVRVTVLAW